jgi:hypothetical protein
MKPLEQKIKDLPPDLQREVEDFVDFILDRRSPRPRGKPTFDWAGALKDLRDQYTSVELQHEISKMRTEHLEKK